MSNHATQRTDITKSASDIPVADFRLLFQWPLIWDPQERGQAFRRDTLDRDLTSEGEWSRVADPLTLLDNTPSYEEFVYFHDFVQDFLFPTARGKTEDSFRLYQRTDILNLQADLQDPVSGGEFSLPFVVERLTLHVFDLGVAIMTLELRCLPNSPPLTLAMCQTTIDRLRRSYTPFWAGETPGRVPVSVGLNGAPGIPPPSRSDAVECLNTSSRDPTVFKHWSEMLAPMKLRGPDGGDWRDPSDERIPVNSFISLTPSDFEDTSPGTPRDQTWQDQMNRDALLQVGESDWYRLWDAEEAGQNYPYNPDFLRKVDDTGFYDRFFPDSCCGGLATRHLFGGLHYSYVGSGSFTDGPAVEHWRRHYAQLSLIARLQVAVLLSLSSRISRAVQLLSGGARGHFGDEILNIQEDFLHYRHRYHFTGVSSQIQASEMYDQWRKTLGIDELYRDVHDELETATAALHSRKQTKLAEAANLLAIVAAVGVLGGLIVGALGSNLFLGADSGGVFLRGWPEDRQLWFIALLCLAFLLLGSQFLRLVLRLGGILLSRMTPNAVAKATAASFALTIAGAVALIAAVSLYLTGR